MQATLTPPAPAGSVTQELAHELALAKGRAKPIHKAARVAAFNGWTTGIVALFSLPFAPFSVEGFVVAVGLVIVAYNEFQGRRRLLAFDPASARFLGWNQVSFLLLIIVYCVWMLWSSMGAFAAEIEAHPELKEALGSLDEFEGLYQNIVIGLYGGVIALSAVFQGCNAIYYFTRRKHVVAYLRETPAWVLDIQRITSAA